MKSRKVLLGLIVGLTVCFTGAATAQNANFGSQKIVEIGPDNVGGRVTSLVVTSSLSDAVSTVYAGSALGGLYTRTNDLGDSWRYIPCYVNGRELTLPISSMIQLTDDIFIIGTGESNDYEKGVKCSGMAAYGHGLFLFSKSAEEFMQIDESDPGRDLDHPFASINCLAKMTVHDTIYVFIGTNQGLCHFHYTTSDTTIGDFEWSYVGDEVRQVIASGQYNRAFFTTANRIFKISDVVNESEPVDITGSCDAFATNCGAIVLGQAPSDQSYLYAFAADTNGLTKGLYLTRNTNSWQMISTSTVTPFNTVATALSCGAICVNPTNPQDVYIAGSTVWHGTGYVENSPYQWTQISSNEVSLNYGDYMSYVYSNGAFCHSGVHQIVADPYWDGTTGHVNYYVVTDGGVFYVENDVFENFNRGLNNTQVIGLDVLPDASLIAGAAGNSCPFIESRMHHVGGENADCWYDHSGTNTNHLANILWQGNGGATAASVFSQFQPLSRRNIFVSSENGAIGRAYADYSDFTNTQTWTTDSSFLSEMIVGGPENAEIYLWETMNNLANDSATFLIDTLDYLIREGVEEHSEELRMGYNCHYQAGDQVTLLDVAHASYPFQYTFTEDGVIGDHHSSYRNADTLQVHLPYISRMTATIVEKDQTNWTAIVYNWAPTDYRHIFQGTADTRYWAFLYSPRHTGDYSVSPDKNRACEKSVITNDGNCVLITVYNDSSNVTDIVRVMGLNDINYNQAPSKICGDLQYESQARLTTDSVIATFEGHVASMSVDPNSDKVYLALDKTGVDGSNIFVIDDASGDEPTFSRAAVLNGEPIFSSLVESTTGTIYLGTENGLYKTTTPGSLSAFEEVGDFRGVPVTVLCQQNADFPIVRHTGHDGVEEVNYVFPKTKWPYAIYIGTFGRGIFMDSTYVTDHTNEIVNKDDDPDWTGIPTVNGNGTGSVRFYPNPAVSTTTMELTIANSGKAIVNIYDLNGKLVRSEQLGTVSEGTTVRTLDCQGLAHGMYLVNVLVGNERTTAKLLVR